MAGIWADIPRRTFFARLVAVVVTLFVALVAAGGPLPAHAASVCSITLDCRVSDGVSDVPLVGDTYGLVRVADVTYDEVAGTITSYQTCDAFASFDYDWSNMKSSEFGEAAKTLAAFASENDLYESVAISDSSGSAGFSWLEPGLYLVTRIAVTDVNAGYVCNPLLVTVPLAERGQLLWDVAVTPKFGETGPDEPDNPEAPPFFPAPAAWAP